MNPPLPTTPRFLLVLALSVLWAPGSAREAQASLNIRDAYSPRNHERPRRSRTDYIVLHTTEGPLKGSLDKLKRNGEAHYLVDQQGKVYRIIDKHRVAHHAGRSMWNGKKNLDLCSIGIEVVGYHNRSIRASQEKALQELLRQLQGVFKVPDERVLPHSMVAYGAPNRWHRHAHRGRKRCAMQFARLPLRRSLGLSSEPRYDPDVRKGRLVEADAHLAKVLFDHADAWKLSNGGASPDGMVVTQGKTAWDLAREKYDDAETLYVYPDGRQVRGNQVSNWARVPVGTKVYLAGTTAGNIAEAVRVLGRHGQTARDLAGTEFNKKSTHYFYPDGRIRRGDRLSEKDFSKLPRETRVLVGYVHGGYITARRSAFDICGEKWNFPSTYYHLPDGRIVAGNRIDENSIPRNAQVFFRY